MATTMVSGGFQWYFRVSLLALSPTHLNLAPQHHDEEEAQAGRPGNHDSAPSGPPSSVSAPVLRIHVRSLIFLKWLFTLVACAP